MSQHSMAVANEAAKNRELLGSTNQDTADEQVKKIKDDAKQQKAQVKEALDNRNSVSDVVANQKTSGSDTSLPDESNKEDKENK